MQIRSDWTQRAVVTPQGIEWVASPAEGVNRAYLERDGEERGRATSFVAYAKGASFPSHTHDLGEEFFVLEGCFEDEQGSYAAGTYVRNPPGSSHAPRSTEGCLLFVKLRYAALYDCQRRVIPTPRSPWLPGLVPGLSVMPLHQFGGESTSLVSWLPGVRFPRHRHPEGEEILVLDGVFEDEHGSYPKGTWLRSPPASEHSPRSPSGCVILVKTGHLRSFRNYGAGI